MEENDQKKLNTAGTANDIKCFKEKPIDERRERLAKLLEKNPNKVPIIFEKHARSRLGESAALKFMSTPSLTLSYFANQIRTALQLPSETALFFSTANCKIIRHTSMIGDLYESDKDPDGFLYVQYREIETFGHR